MDNTELTAEELQELKDAVLTPLYLKKGLTDDEMEGFYKVGYDLYKAGNYDKAETVFKGLCTLDPMSEKYHMALGGACQAQQKWEMAVKQYGLVCSLINVTNVTASTRAAECLEKLGQKDKAAMAREHAKFYAGKTYSGKEA